nr:hypothetical protein [Candidatus Sigynarchaeum springense]MDO8118660.1 hypothetical protein [Candidatus Sigynarchaeota archaeon]
MLYEAFGNLGIIALILMWLYQGFNLKFIDQIVDEGKKVHILVIWLVMPLSGIVAGFFMCLDSFTGGCVLALILGMIIANKIDHKLWFVQIILVLGAYIVFLNVFIMIDVHLIANFIEVIIIFIIVLFGSILDEILHDMSENKNVWLLKIFGGYRAVMKIAVIIMAILFPSSVIWYHVLAWVLFDIMYEIQARRETRKKLSKK